MKRQLLHLLIGLVAETAMAAPSFGDSAMANATQTIIHKIQIKKISDLNFGEAAPGDGPKSIAPGSNENSENASFEIYGEPHHSFQIILPSPGSVKMISGEGGLNREIPILSFASNPNLLGKIDEDGKLMIFVGATRGLIPRTQKTGEYIGQFHVTVVY